VYARILALETEGNFVSANRSGAAHNVPATAPVPVILVPPFGKEFEMLKNAFSPRIMTLEGRDQPGSMFSTGLDSSILAGVFEGDALMRASCPANSATQAPIQRTDAPDVAVQPFVDEMNAQSAGTLMQAETPSLDEINGLVSDTNRALTAAEFTGLDQDFQRPGSDSGSRENNVFYGGDFDGRNGLANEFNSVVTDARTYDDIRVRFGYDIECVFSRNLMDDMAADVVSANWEIRGPGMIETGVPPPIANGGTAFGIAAAATITPTGFSGFELIEYEVKVCGLSGLNILPSGHYYLNVQPIGAGTGRSFQSTTSGAGPVKGQPIANDDTWFDSPPFGYSYVPASDIFGAGTWDFSGGMEGTYP
jgi:hypothetical protein